MTNKLRKLLVWWSNKECFLVKEKCIIKDFQRNFKICLDNGFHCVDKPKYYGKTSGAQRISTIFWKNLRSAKILAISSLEV